MICRLDDRKSDEQNVGLRRHSTTPYVGVMITVFEERGKS